MHLGCITKRASILKLLNKILVVAIQALLKELTGHYIRAGLYSLNDFNPGLTVGDRC
jgi:hypothetical protein